MMGKGVIALVLFLGLGLLAQEPAPPEGEQPEKPAAPVC